MINFTKLLGGTPGVSEMLKAVSRKKHSALYVACNASRPLVVFNVTRYCNLECRHCYLKSRDKLIKGELSLAQIKKVLDSLGEMEIPVLLLSGGEPLAHKDIFTIIEYAKSKNIRVGLSTNGTLITKPAACRLNALGVDYVGVSIDGKRQRHDYFRRMKGAYERSIRGIRNAQDAGLKAGVRFTITKLNAADLPAVIDMCLKENIPRFCMYHLVYAGRGTALAAEDIDNAQRRQVVDFLIRRTQECNAQGKNIEILSVDNHADGIYIYLYLKQKNPAKAKEVLRLLKFHGGCSAASKVVDVSPDGNVFPCQFWHEDMLGSVKEEDFYRIWLNRSNRKLQKLRHKAQYLKGKCSRCRYQAYCGGCRVRAFTVYGDFWQEDPCCYLEEKEIG
ncbi:MAG: radical SAM protein [Candidatus Omnitrophica bacterium]|nr:radical SAM protein [Candidatus Omnitrophota bacterium]MBU4479283.1 radical SAM protein [Candidatus Omnitrophota bacterium]